MSAPAQRRSRLALVAPSPPERAGGPVLGSIVSFERGEVRVTFPGNLAGPAVARALASLDDATLERSAREEAEVLLVFENGDPARPVILGLLRSATPLMDALLAGPQPTAEKVARVDGRRVVIQGEEEVVLRCGKATLTLRRDGKVVLRGVNLITQAEQVHKIRGGKVQVN